MGVIKDIVELAKELETRVKDGRDRELLHKIQNLVFTLQGDHVDIVERDVALIRENDELKRKLAELESEEVRIHRFIEFRRGNRTGGKWTPFCPKCHIPAANQDGYLDVICSDRACKWKITLNDISLSGVVKELE